MATLSIHRPSTRGADRPDELPTLDSLNEVVQTLRAHEEVFLRVSPGPWVDLRRGSRDPESGYLLPGFPVQPLRPEAWWAGAPATWVARQLTHHSYRMRPGWRPWLLAGPVVGRGAGCEPLVRPSPLALVGDGALTEAETVHAAWRCRAFC